MEPPQPNFRLFLVSSAIGWTAFYPLRLSLIMTRYFQAPGISIPAAITLDVIDHLASAAISIMVWYWMTQRRLVSKGWSRTTVEGFAIAMLLNMAITGACLMPFRAIYESHLGPTAVYESTILHLMAAPLWFALVLAFVYFDHNCGLERQRAHSERAAREAQLHMLRGQVNPHFLFNSFNSLRALIAIDAAKAADALDQIADILRYSLTSSQPRTVPLSEELTTIHQYLALEKLRLDTRLTIESEIEPGMETFAIPPLAIQGLVENAIKHGPGASRKGGKVAIRIERECDNLIATVSNTGKLATNSVSTRIGLHNLRERLRLLYGGTAWFELREEPGPLVVARLLIPPHSPQPCP